MDFACSCYYFNFATIISHYFAPISPLLSLFSLTLSCYFHSHFYFHLHKNTFTTITPLPPSLPQHKTSQGSPWYASTAASTFSSSPNSARSKRRMNCLNSLLSCLRERATKDILIDNFVWSSSASSPLPLTTSPVHSALSPVTSIPLVPFVESPTATRGSSPVPSLVPTSPTSILAASPMTPVAASCIQICAPSNLGYGDGSTAHEIAILERFRLMHPPLFP